ncbi:hypothetical protein NFHSH190041_07470 [Shewanella sp. NFH-SH190041]|nr:hypothetical protein NFHSH190041_07470 [Shewanella sp. NFH-SH190041]
MNQSFNELWQCYQSTKFLMTQKLSPLLSFAIITAWNPLGENLSNGQNALLDRQLQNELIKKRSFIGNLSVPVMTILIWK